MKQAVQALDTKKAPDAVGKQNQAIDALERTGRIERARRQGDRTPVLLAVRVPERRDRDRPDARPRGPRRQPHDRRARLRRHHRESV